MIPVWVASLAGAVFGGLVVFAVLYQRCIRAESDNRLLSEKIITTEESVSREKATRENLEKEFRLVAADTLQKTSEQFLSIAIRDLRQVKTETDVSVGKQRNEIESFVQDMKARLEDSEKLIARFEKERHEMYGRLDGSIEQVLNTGNLIRLEAGALKKALTAGTGVRGKWGEHILEEILAQNNFVRGVNYDTQVTLSANGEPDLRPDFVVRLPGNKKLVIDSKDVTGEYLLAQETDDAENQKDHYGRLVENISSNFMRLSRKEYQSQLDPEVPFVVMFIPSEAAIRAAFATNPDIFREATERKVILASPMTMMPLLYLIANGWQKQKLADNARELGGAVEELGNRLFKFIDHLQNVRAGIGKAAESWDKAMGSWRSKVSPQIEKTRALGGKLKESDLLEVLDGEKLPITENNPD